MKNATQKIKGFINETHTQEVEKVFGKEVAAKLEKANGMTFLDFLMKEKPI